MQIIVDANDAPERIRLAASFLLHLVGDLPEAAAPAPTHTPENGLPLPPLGAGPLDPDIVFPAAPPAPPAPVNFPTPPAPLSAPVAAAESASPAASVPAPTPSAASAASVTEYDSAGLPWDARIHQSRKGKKKDGTWKLQKGIDPAVASAVVAELAARSLPPSTVPPPPGTVPTPPVSQTVPLPLPVPPVTAASAVPVNVPTPPAPVPASAAAPAAGAVPVPVAGSGFRELIRKASEATKAGKLDPAKLQSIVQARGAANLQALRDMPQAIPDVEADIEAVLLGVA